MCLSLTGIGSTFRVNLGGKNEERQIDEISGIASDRWRVNFRA